MKKFIEIIKNKWLKNVLLTVLLFAIIICAFAVITWGVRKANIADLDFTSDKIYSISQATKDKLSNLDQDITITVYKMHDYVKDFTHKYEKVSDHIKVEELENLTSKIDIKTNYGITDDTAFILIESESKEKILYDYNLYTYDYTTYKEIDITEEAITNAIIDVVTNVQPKICFLTGHNQYSETYFKLLENSLISEINEVEYVDLLKSGSVPKDCKVLVITALKNDITKKEKDEILKYINNGGEILLLLDPNLNKIKTPNFQKILDVYGVKNSEGLILEGDSNHMISGAPNIVISTINSDSEIAKNINMELNVCMLNPGKLSFDSSEKLEQKGVTLETLATVSDKAFYRTDLNLSNPAKTKKDEDAAGQTIAAMLTKKINEEKTSKLIVFANTAFASNMQVQLESQYYMYPISIYNNEDILLNSVSYLSEREDNITIRKSGEAVTTYDVSDRQTTIVLSIIFTIPIIIIIAGIVIWQIRRRKNK